MVLLPRVDRWRRIGFGDVGEDAGAPGRGAAQGTGSRDPDGATGDALEQRRGSRRFPSEEPSIDTDGPPAERRRVVEGLLDCRCEPLGGRANRRNPVAEALEGGVVLGVRTVESA